jgi:hypothetical protein
MVLLSRRSQLGEGGRLHLSLFNLFIGAVKPGPHGRRLVSARDVRFEKVPLQSTQCIRTFVTSPVARSCIMEAKCFGCGLPGMGAARECLAQMVSLARRSGFAQFAVLVLAGLALLLSGCASHRSGTPNASGAAGFNEPQVSPFGTVEIADDSSPASFSFQKAKGKLGSAKDAIKDSAELGLSGPGAGLIVSGEVLSWFGQSDLQGLGNAGPASLYIAGAVVGVAGGATAVGAALAGPVVRR